MASSLTVECHQPELTEHFDVGVCAGQPQKSRCRPVILQELHDPRLREALVQFFALFVNLVNAPIWERPILFVMVDLTADEKFTQYEQAQRLKMVLASINALKEHGTAAEKLAANSVCFNNPWGLCRGLTLKQSNLLLRSTVRRSTVSGVNFLRQLSGRKQAMQQRLIKLSQEKTSYRRPGRQLRLSQQSRPAICCA